MFQCPACPAAFEVLPEICPECGLSLRVLSLEPVLKPTGDGLVVLADFDSELSAMIIKGRLAADNIEAMIGSTGMQTMFGDNDPGSIVPYQLLVRREDAAAALRVLSTDTQWTEDELARYLTMLEEAGEA